MTLESISHPLATLSWTYPYQATSAFGRVAWGPVNLEPRILENPILTSEDPTFEIRWLLKHGKLTEG